MESLALVPEMLPSILFLSGSGMVNQQTKYATKVIPPVRKANTAHATLTMVGSTPKYSATPAATPEIFLSFDFINFFSISLLFNFRSEERRVGKECRSR